MEWLSLPECAAWHGGALRLVFQGCVDVCQLIGKVMKLTPVKLTPACLGSMYQSHASPVHMILEIAMSHTPWMSTAALFAPASTALRGTAASARMPSMHSTLDQACAAHACDESQLHRNTPHSHCSTDRNECCSKSMGVVAACLNNVLNLSSKLPKMKSTAQQVPPTKPVSSQKGAVAHLQRVHGLVQGVVLLVEPQQECHDPECKRHRRLQQQSVLQSHICSHISDRREQHVSNALCMLAGFDSSRALVTL